MKKKAAKKVLKIYAVCSLVLISCCVCLFIWSGLEKAVYGEFRVLPVLNMAQFESFDGVWDEEADAMLVGAVEYRSQLEESGHGLRIRCGALSTSARRSRFAICPCGICCGCSRPGMIPGSTKCC